MQEPVQPPPLPQELADQLEDHKGQWVAVYQGALVAYGASAAEVFKSARDKGITDPTVFRVPAHPERLAYFSLASI
jgi:hypothetical protein